MDDQTLSYLQTFGCGVLLIDAAGRITFANGVAQRSLGLTARDLLQP
ncbi:MAG: PAS domain-containing protein [Desulfuromonadales bacterium]